MVRLANMRPFACRNRWRSLQPVDRDYWCFTHVIDSGGKIAGYLDHQILDGEPPTSQLRQGDTGMESLLFRAFQSGTLYRLKLGVFDRATGKRLKITASSFPVTDDGTAAIR